MPRWRKITHDDIQAAVAKEVRSTENLDGLHVFTDAELRDRDERIIRATLGWWDFDGSYGAIDALDDDDRDEAVEFIIAAAEADQ